MFAAKENDKPLVLSAFFISIFIIAIPYLSTSQVVNVVNAIASSSMCEGDQQGITVTMTYDNESTTIFCGFNTGLTNFVIIALGYNFLFAFIFLMFNRILIRYRFYIHLLGFILLTTGISIIAEQILTSTTCQNMNSNCGILAAYCFANCTTVYYLAMVVDGYLACLALAWTTIRSFGARKKLIKNF